MPRPGPRPYECVKRAWHSDRHQPMRGSIIQQIFRVVNEAHSSATRKNKEWQEKLPIVVLKAEEIMYSKANSEAEYMDPETLWDRVNDAINTIIRRDESTETGELLPPCVEAALNLGCVPVRASRSQRHSNPRSYLSPRSPESGFVRPKILVSTTNEQTPNLSPVSQLTLARPTMNLTNLASQSNRHVMQNNNLTSSCNSPLSHQKFPPRGNNQFIQMQSGTSLNVGSVYPLHYGTNFQPDMSQLGFQTRQNSNKIIVGTPLFSSTVEPSEVAYSQNLFFRDGNENASNRTTQADFRDNHEKAPDMECDLSLRLGLFSDQCTSVGKCSTRDSDDVGLSSSQEGNKFSDPSTLRNKEFPFFPMKNVNDPFEFCTSKWTCEGEGQDVEAAVRKRKAPFNNDVEEGQFFWLPGQMKRPEFLLYGFS
ncbi:uncharacterized protein LOC132279883 [Cornus florida]|uniref:uncharacterized protein LOC132279883 n=1 Tax=Cornus florida TaxID=4283 RepID=UPI00289F91D3|nr:uncharacterized protein LOC132279883 [Cornus florida]